MTHALIFLAGMVTGAVALVVVVAVACVVYFGLAKSQTCE